MTSYAITYQLDIYNAAGTSVALSITSVAGGTNPYLADEDPVGDGQEFNPLTGDTRRGQYTGRIIDVITSGTTRIVTGNLEDSGFRQQLMRRKAILKMILDGATTVVLCAGLLTDLRLVNTLEYQYTVTDRTRVQGDQKIFAPRSGVVTLSASAIAGATTLSCEALPLDLAKHTELNFGSGKSGVVAADASAGATSITVTGLGIGGSTSLALADDDQATYKESIAAFLTRWPQRGCAFGGPIIGGFLGRGDSGGWTMRYELFDGTTPFLRFISGAGPTGSAVLTDINHEAMAPLTNGAVGDFRQGEEPTVAPITTFKHAGLSHFANDLIVEVVGAGYYAPDVLMPEASFRTDTEYGLVDTEKNRQGVFLALGTGLIPGKEYRVRAYTAEVSELSPIYHTAHPVDWTTKILTELGYAYDATSMATLKQTIGADLLYSDQIAKPENGAAWLASTILGPFGIGLRMGDDGEVEGFSTRIFTNSAPATTITDDDVVTPEEGGAGEVFAISESTAIAAVTFEHYSLYVPGAQISTPTHRVANRKATRPDAVEKRLVRIERLNGDPGVVGNQTHEWSVNGMVHRLDSYAPANDFLDLAIREIFDRFGRGVIECELPFLRGGSGDALRIGDECIVRVKQLPNKNKRYGDDTSVGGRAMQVVRYTPRASGALVKLLDSGPNAAAFGTAPTVTIAAASGGPFKARRVAALTITNAATLNAAGAGAYVLMAVNLLTPAATDYARVRWFDPGEIPIGAFALPTVVGGRRVWAKAVAIKPGFRPSAASSAANVILTSISPVSALVVTPDGSDGTVVDVEWTVGEDDHLVDVFRRRTAGTTSADDVRLAELAPGSVQYTDTTARPGVGYTYSVQHRHPTQNDTSSLVTGTGTTNSADPDLDAPTGARGFAGQQDAAFGITNAPGIYGIAVRAAFDPSEIEAEVSVDGGTTYSSIGQVPARQGTWTPVTDIAANDGIARKLRARHWRPGQSRRDCIAAYTVAEVAAMDVATAAALGASLLASDWSDVVTVTPYTNTAIQKTTKSLRMGSSLFQPSNPFDIWIRDLGALSTGSGEPATTFFASVDIPAGATIVSWNIRTAPQTSGEIEARLVKVDSSGAVATTLSTLNTIGSAGTIQTDSDTVGALVDASFIYVIEMTIDNSATVVSPGNDFIYAEFAYTSPFLDVGL